MLQGNTVSLVSYTSTSMVYALSVNPDRLLVARVARFKRREKVKKKEEKRRTFDQMRFNPSFPSNLASNLYNILGTV